MQGFCAEQVEDKTDGCGASQTNNISEGGMAFIARKQFVPSTNLKFTIELPVLRTPVLITGTVKESKKINPHYAFFTRVSFCEMEDHKRRAIQQTVAYYSRKNLLML